MNAIADCPEYREAVTARARLVAHADWSQGTPVAYLRELCEYWREEYDRCRLERRLNALPQFMTELGSVDVHLLRVRSPHPEALPLLTTHGWPGSVLEFLAAIGPLLPVPELRRRPRRRDLQTGRRAALGRPPGARPLSSG